MAKNKYGVANSFSSAFMQGFSFIDDIHRRRRADERLEEELARNRRRQDIADERQSTLFRQSQDDRTSRLTNEQRLREASSLLADPNVSDAELEQYADIPQVSAFLAGRRKEAEQLEDVSAVFGQQPGGAPAGQPPGNQVAQQPGGLAAQVEAAALPANGPQPTMTEAEIQELSFTDPAAAAVIRDEQAVQREREAEGRRQAGEAQTRARAAGLRPGERAMTPFEQEEAARQRQEESEATQATAQWRAFGDVNTAGHDSINSLPSGTLVAQYWDGRSQIDDPQVVADADRRMRPHITNTINETRAVLADPNLDPNSMDARRATRHLQRAMGLAQELNVSYSPLREGGVDSRGLPLNGNNPALTNNAIAAAQSGPGTPIPNSPSRTRADMTVVNRGTRGNRLTERQTQAAFRLYKGGLLPLDSFTHYMQTGRLPSSAPEVKFEQFDPERPVYANVNGHLQMVLPPSRISDEELNRSRNLFGDEGLSMLNRLASAYDTPDDPQGGTRMIQAFRQAVSFNEKAISGRQMRLNNVNDVERLWRYWTDINVIRDAYNDEVFVDGRINPDFNQVYGDMNEVFMDPRFNQEFIEERNLRVGGTTTAGLGGDEFSVMEVPPRDPALYDRIRREAPEFANATDQEIETVLREQGL